MNGGISIYNIMEKLCKDIREILYKDITSLNKEIVSILRSPDIQKQLNQMGVSVTPSSPEEFKKLIAFEVVKFQKIAKAANIQPE
jgi:tripartite-type tricarboxylate transporter receptor subunit TctC